MFHWRLGKLNTLVLAFPLPIAILSSMIPSPLYSEVVIENPKGQDREGREASLGPGCSDEDGL